ncbi:MAG: cation:proton antiporter [Pseudomonadales bacterium]|nr:cation:proton antiporter [Pseudomonadales bacterium]
MHSINTLNPAEVLLTLGGLFILGLMADLLGRYTLLPRVTLLLLAGFSVGPGGLDVLPLFVNDWFPIFTNIALSFVGFLLGQKLTRSFYLELGKPVLTISLFLVVTTSILVFCVVYFLGYPAEIALILAGIALATDPAATVDVVNEQKAKGKFSDTLLGIVAIDDAWGLLIFSLLLAVAQSLNVENGTWAILLPAAWEIGGAIILGIAIGIPMAYLTGRIVPGEPTQAEALGAVLLCAGLSEYAGVSFILSAMVLGIMVANLADHHERPFHAIQGIEWPALVLFFLLAGASLRLDSLLDIGLLGILYVFLRSLGRFIGAKIGGMACKAKPSMQNWMGFALLPQAGVAIGMSVVAVQHFPETRDVIIPLVLATTVVFELIGPPLTKLALIKVGDVSDVDSHH